MNQQHGTITKTGETTLGSLRVVIERDTNPDGSLFCLFYTVWKYGKFVGRVAGEDNFISLLETLI